MPYSRKALSAQTMWDQPIRLPYDASRPFSLSGQPDSDTVTVVAGPSTLAFGLWSCGLANINSQVFWPPWLDAHSKRMSSFGTTFLMVTGRRMSNSGNFHVTVFLSSNGPLVS